MKIHFSSNQKHNFKNLLAYICMPVGFCVLGYLLIYIVFTPIITPVLSVSEMFISDADFKNGENLTSIFDKNSASSENTGDTVDMSQVQIPSYGTHYANLSIDSVSIDAPLYFGDSSAALSQGVAQYNGSFLPGFGRPILISGHNNSYFNSIQYISVGDEITITTNYGVYKYKVTETKIAAYNDKTAYDLAAQEENLILYTCYPFDTLGLTPQRFFVYADKVSGPDVV